MHGEYLYVGSVVIGGYFHCIGMIYLSVTYPWYDDDDYHYYDLHIITEDI